LRTERRSIEEERLVHALRKSENGQEHPNTTQDVASEGQESDSGDAEVDYLIEETFF
jgi:hypothetical protein